MAQRKEEDDASRFRAEGPPSTPTEVLGRLEARTPQASRYAVGKEVARGGMGAILRVFDPELHRELAMKVLLGGSEAPPVASDTDERMLSRFLDEAQITGQLDHPGVVPVHELGLDPEGRLYFTMRLVRGRDLEHVLWQLRQGHEDWTLTRVLQVLLKVCQAMAYAHSKGVVHRDLKPANVMVGRFGEVYVMDWGLARVLGQEDHHDLRLREAPRAPAAPRSFVRTDRLGTRDADADSPLVTMDGDVVGTPSYMSPEQARGELEHVDRRSDVYSLGAMLYHVLAGHAPYLGGPEPLSNLAVWGLVQAGPPRSLHEVGRDAPAELVAICEKAMARAPDERYADMQALADDLQSFLEGRVVHAYETGAVAELRKWVRRNRATAAASAAALVLAVGGLGATSWVQARAKERLGAKNEELRTASVALREARDSAVASEKEALAEKRHASASAQEAVRERDASERVVGFLVDLFESSDPRNARGADVTVREVLERGAKQLSTLEDEPLVAARLQDAIGGAYSALGLYDEARPFLEQALERRRTGLGEDAADTLASLDHLGLLDYHAGRYDDARERLEQALEARERVLGPDDVATQESRIHLALVERKEGRYDDAAHLLTKALAALRAKVGEGAEETLRAENDLGGVLLRKGDLAGARPLLEAAYEGRRKLLGEDHPDTLISENDLGFLLTQVGELDRARELLEQCLATDEKVMGPEHPFTLTVTNNLAGVLRQQGDLDRAEELLSGALDVARRVLGEEHPNTLGILNGLATVLNAKGFQADAAALFEEALPGIEKKLGPTHPNTLDLLANLAAVYRSMGRTADALRTARTLLERTPKDDPARAEREALVRSLEAGG